MISVKKINQKNFQILIQPNSSLNGWARFFFLLSIFILCGGIAVIFYFVGAIMILPFAGIELGVVFLAFYLNFKWSQQKELVYLSPELVTVERGRKQKEYEWKEFRTFTVFEVSNKTNGISLGFTSKGKKVIIGDFLNHDDKVKLRFEVETIIDYLNKLDPAV